jgi:hypothetical protein
LRFNRTIFRRVRSTAAAACLVFATSANAAPLRVAYSAISGAMAPLWVAQEGGYFKREGLDVELLYIGGGSLLIQSMRPIPYVRPEGVEEILKKIPGKEAREAKPENFIDNTLIKELEQSGWFKSLER